jgi:hypothetical protein
MIDPDGFERVVADDGEPFCRRTKLCDSWTIYGAFPWMGSSLLAAAILINLGLVLFGRRKP